MNKNTGKQKYNFDITRIHTVRKVNTVRCKHCRDILSFDNLKDKSVKGEYTQLHLSNLGYCSKWCYEIDNPPKIKNICKFCDNVTGAIINSKGVTKGFRTICNSCISLGRGRLTPRIALELERDKTLDLIYEKE